MLKVSNRERAVSSAGRATDLHSVGRGFESLTAHSDLYPVKWTRKYLTSEIRAIASIFNQCFASYQAHFLLF